MARKKPNKTKKSRKPKVGDTVYYIGATEHRAMTLAEIITKEGKEYGRCTWERIWMEGNETKHEPQEKLYPMSTLSLTSPPVKPIDPKAFNRG